MPDRGRRGRLVAAVGWSLSACRRLEHLARVRQHGFAVRCNGYTKAGTIHPGARRDDATAVEWRDDAHAAVPQLSRGVRARAVVAGALRDLPRLLAPLRRRASARRAPRPGPAPGALPGVRPPHAPPRPATWSLHHLR